MYGLRGQLALSPLPGLLLDLGVGGWGGGWDLLCVKDYLPRGGG